MSAVDTLEVYHTCNPVETEDYKMEVMSGNTLVIHVYMYVAFVLTETSPQLL